MTYALTTGLNRFQATAASTIMRTSNGSKRKIDFSGANSAPKSRRGMVSRTDSWPAGLDSAAGLRQQPRSRRC